MGCLNVSIECLENIKLPAMIPHQTLRSLLVHPEDKIKLENKCEVVYQLPYKQCEKVYIGETGLRPQTQ